jgi:hypothetical protein
MRVSYPLTLFVEGEKGFRRKRHAHDSCHRFAVSDRAVRPHFGLTPDLRTAIGSRQTLPRALQGKSAITSSEWYHTNAGPHRSYQETLLYLPRVVSRGG